MPAELRDDTALRVFLDANVWISDIVSRRTSAQPTVVLRLLRIVRSMRAGHWQLQVMLSEELLDTIDRVLKRLGFERERIDAFVGALIDLAATGPQRLKPELVLSGRDQLALHDREDAGILASCIAARVDLLVTDNLRDFETNDTIRLATRSVRSSDLSRRDLFTLIYARSDGVALVVMHPVDALSWLQAGRKPTPAAVRAAYSDRP